MTLSENFDSATKFSLLNTKTNYSNEILEAVDRIWKSSVEKYKGRFFDGDIFSVESISSNIVSLSKSKYRLFLAQQENPDLYDELQIRLLAVSGILICNDGIVFGRRSPEVLQDSNAWELLPSGSVTAREFVNEDILFNIDYQIREELLEESGIPKNFYKVITPKMLVESEDSHVVDFVYEIQVNISKSQIIDFHKNATSEYTQLEVVDSKEIVKFIDQNNLVKTSRKIIEHYM